MSNECSTQSMLLNVARRAVVTEKKPLPSRIVQQYAVLYMMFRYFFLLLWTTHVVGF
jgi:hypothetical protein